MNISTSIATDTSMVVVGDNVTEGVGREGGSNKLIQVGRKAINRYML